MVERVAIWDNAKFFVLVLVVAGHLMDGIRFDGLAANWLYTSIYLFHMPLMMFIAGYFSRAELSAKVANSIIQLCVTYLLWEVLIGVFRYFLSGWTPSADFISTPSRAMWFLLSLACLKLVLPVFIRLKHPLAVAVLIALAAGAFQGIDDTLTISRTLGFLPFFVGGYVSRQRGVFEKSWFHQPTVKMRVGAGAFTALVGTVLWVALSQDDLPAVYRWLYRRYNYWELTDSNRARIELLPVDGSGDSTWLVVANGVLANGLLLVLAFAVGFAVLLLIPRSRIVLTSLGQNTLYIYLLHIPLIHVESEFGIVPELFANLGVWALALVLVVSTIVALVLGSSSMKRLTRRIVEPDVSGIVTDT